MDREDETVQIQLFISPVDAILDGRIRAPEGGIDIIGIHNDMRVQKNTTPTLHLAWRAHSGKLTLDAAGNLLPVTYGFSRGHGKSMNVVPDGTVLQTFSLIREMCGLYAWKETAREFLFWHVDQQTRAINRGLEVVQAGVRNSAETFNQLAVFDPEFMQWHFVSVSDLSECLNANGFQIYMDNWS